MGLEDYSKQHKKAWEFDAYDFWVRTAGTPEERASKDRENPKKMLKQYANYFDSFAGAKVDNICGSCGKKAIPLALLGQRLLFGSGFTLERFDGHPSWENEKLPGEFTAIGRKKD